VQLSGGAVRVSSRFAVDDLGELFGLELDDDDVDSVGGLMAKHLGKVPIPGSEIEVEGLLFVAEAPTGRRNRIATVVVRPVEPLDTEETAQDAIWA